MRVRPGFVQRFWQFAFAPGFVLRGGNLDAVHRRMPASVEGMQQLALTQGQQSQHAVIHGQLALAFELAQQAAAIAARGLQGAAGYGPGQCCRAQRQAADHQVHSRTGSGACGNPAAHANPQLLEGFGVEQVITPAAVQQWQITGRGIACAKSVEFEQGFNAALFPLPDCLAQFVDGLLLGVFFADHAAATGGAVDQQFSDQAQGTVLACFALCLLVGNQALQGLA